MGEKPPHYYETALIYEKNKVGWTDIPLGDKLEKPTENFLKLVSALAYGLYYPLCADTKDIRKNTYLNPYFKKNPADEMETVKNMRDELKLWLQNITQCFEFWQEIQQYTRLGEPENKNVVGFFKVEHMNKLEGVLNFTLKPRENEKLFAGDGDKEPDGEPWQNFIGKPDKKRLVDANDPKDKLKWMVEDIWNIIIRKEG